MKMIIDSKMLKNYLLFEYLQIFETDNIDAPTLFKEHSAGEVAPPNERRFKIASNRILMRLAIEKKRPVLFIAKDEVLVDWQFDIMVVFVKNAHLNLVILFYMREAPLQVPDTSRIAEAIKGI